MADRRLMVLREQIRRLHGQINNEVETFADLADRWFQSVSGGYKPGSARRRALCIRNLKPYFRDVPLRRVALRHCEAWLKDRGAHLSESSFNQELETLKKIFEFGLEQSVLLDNPARRIKRRRLKKAVVTVPTREEFRKLLAVLQAADGRSIEASKLVKLLAFSGMRLAEATALTWGDIDFGRKTFRVSGGERGTKNRRERIVPLFPALESFLLELTGPKAPGDRIVSIDSAKRAIASACTTSKMSKITHHSLRHFFVSNAIEKDVNFATIAAWVGHLDGGELVAKTYGHLRESHSHKMAERMTFQMTEGK